MSGDILMLAQAASGAGEEELPLLACAGALLLLGIPPEELGQALS